jgi:hypothetical protein
MGSMNGSKTPKKVSPMDPNKKVKITGSGSSSGGAATTPTLNNTGYLNKQVTTKSAPDRANNSARVTGSGPSMAPKSIPKDPAPKITPKPAQTPPEYKPRIMTGPSMAPKAISAPTPSTPTSNKGRVGR